MGGQVEPSGRSLDRRLAVGIAISAGLLFVVLAAVLVPWEWSPDRRPVTVTSGSLFSPEQLDRMAEYSSLRRTLSWWSYGVSLLVTLVLGFTRRGAQLIRRLTSRMRWWFAVPVAVIALLVVGRIVTLPFAIAAHRAGVRYGLSTQGWAAWSADVGRSLLVSAVTATLVALLVVGTARRSPRRWFTWGGALAVVLTLAGSFLYPVVVEPLFNRFTPMSAGPLKTSLIDLAQAEGVEVDDVLVADASRRTTTLNAYVSGIGTTRRVVVYDTLLDSLPPDQVRVVVAHELAHAKHRDVLVGTGLGAVGALAGVCVLAIALDSRALQRRAGFSGPTDPGVVAVVFALVAAGGLVATPTQNAISRAVEARADHSSLVATGSSETFVRMQKRLAVRALSDPTPPTLEQLWIGSHPTVLQRVQMARNLGGRREKAGGPVGSSAGPP